MAQMKAYILPMKKITLISRLVHLPKEIQNWVVWMVGWFSLQQKWDSYPATSFLEAFYLVMKENDKKVGKSYHLGVNKHPHWFMF